MLACHKTFIPSIYSEDNIYNITVIYTHTINLLNYKSSADKENHNTSILTNGSSLQWKRIGLLTFRLLILNEGEENKVGVLQLRSLILR